MAVVGATIGYSLMQTPVYEASIKMIIGQKQSGAFEGLGSEIPGLQQLTITMTEAVETRPVAEAVVRELNLEMSAGVLLKNLSAEQIGNTQFIEVSYTDSDPERARRVADTIGEVFSRQVSEVSPSTNAIAATVWEHAEVPKDPVSPNLPLNCLLALVVGATLGVGLAFLLEYRDDSWRSPEEAEQVSGVPTFGVIPRYKVPKAKKG
jgi:capsular polysaccharide biosynthesis protein